MQRGLKKAIYFQLCGRFMVFFLSDFFTDLVTYYYMVIIEKKDL